MNVLGIIPARGGSKGLPNKNIMPLLGKPLMAYVIEAACATDLLTDVVVTTDSDAIAELAVSYKLDVIRRPEEFSNDTAPIDLALRHATTEAERSHGPYDMVVWMQANVPTTTSAVIDQVIRALQNNGGDSVATVCPYEVPPQWAWRLENDRMVPLEKIYSYSVLRQQQIQAFHLDGAVNAFRRDVLMSTEGQPGQAYFGTDRRAVIQARENSIEIDDAFDLLIAETILRHRLERSRSDGGLQNN